LKKIIDELEFDNAGNI